jgi:peptide/nickel transport system substrate-binding protein
MSQNPLPGTIVIVVVPGDRPVPTLGNAKANADVSDLMFLRLARIGPDFVTSGDRGFVPQLAEKWQRRDSLTLAFELNRRARWHDGRPVTAKDVVWSFDRIKTGADAQKAVLLRSISSMTAENDRTVVVRFSRVYAEQLYDRCGTCCAAVASAGHHSPGSWPPRIRASPVGAALSLLRREPGRQVELVANPTSSWEARHRAGRVPTGGWRSAQSALDGTANASEGITPVSNVPRVQAAICGFCPFPPPSWATCSSTSGPMAIVANPIRF